MKRFAAIAGLCVLATSLAACTGNQTQTGFVPMATARHASDANGVGNIMATTRHTSDSNGNGNVLGGVGP